MILFVHDAASVVVSEYVLPAIVESIESGIDRWELSGHAKNADNYDAGSVMYGVVYEIP